MGKPAFVRAAFVTLTAGDHWHSAPMKPLREISSQGEPSRHRTALRAMSSIVSDASTFISRKQSRERRWLGGVQVTGHPDLSKIPFYVDNSSIIDG
jgi:hypothetical protein